MYETWCARYCWVTSTRAEGGGGGAAVVDVVSVGVSDVDAGSVVDVGGDADVVDARVNVDAELLSADDVEMLMSPYVSERCAEDRTADAYDIDTDDGAGGG